MKIPSNNPEVQIYCYLDTNVFDQHGLNFASPSLGQIKTQANIGHIALITTDILLREIESHWPQKLKELKSKHNAFTSYFNRLPHVPDNLKSTHSPSDINAINEFDFTRCVRQFFEDCYATNLTSKQIRLGRVLDTYFSNQPPFNEGKNKYEFPDAFMIDLLEQFHDEHNCDIHVVTTDRGFLSYAGTCSWMSGYKNLNDFLKINRATVETQADHVSAFLRKNTDAMREQIHSFVQNTPIWHEHQRPEFSIVHPVFTNVSTIDIDIENFPRPSHDLYDTYIITLEINLKISGTVQGTRKHPNNPVPWHVGGGEEQSVVYTFSEIKPIRLMFFLFTGDIRKGNFVPNGLELFCDNLYNEIRLNGALTDPVVR